MIPEMLTAGLETLAEERARGADDRDTVIAIYLAMRGIEEIFSMQRDQKVMH